MNILTLDVETTISNKGNPYDSTNRLVCYSYHCVDECSAVQWTNRTPTKLLNLLGWADLVLGFNFKFDAHWLTRHGISFQDKKIWDVQIAEFILSRQTNRFPSLNETCIKYGHPTKRDAVKEDFWDKGIDTDKIPWEILSDYAAFDAHLTYLCYCSQIKLMTPEEIKLCRIQCEDMMILMEMEQNGLPFDEELCDKRSKELDSEIESLKAELKAIYPNVPINFGSNDHLSAFLYGGIVKEDGKEFVGYFKTGARANEPRYKNITIEHQLPRLYVPLKGSEMAKAGNFATDEGTLRKLKGKKGVLDKILHLSKLEKLNGTYYNGLVKLRKQMNWEPNVLHGQFNQTTAISGRLSSSKPNLQNFATDLQDIFISKYND